MIDLLTFPTNLSSSLNCVRVRVEFIPICRKWGSMCELKHNLMSSAIGLPDTCCDGVATSRVDTPGIGIDSVQ